MVFGWKFAWSWGKTKTSANDNYFSIKTSEKESEKRNTLSEKEGVLRTKRENETIDWGVSKKGGDHKIGEVD